MFQNLCHYNYRYFTDVSGLLPYLLFTGLTRVGWQVLVGGLLKLMQYLPITTIIVGNTNIDLYIENIQSSGGKEYEAVLNIFWFF